MYDVVPCSVGFSPRYISIILNFKIKVYFSLDILLKCNVSCIRSHHLDGDSIYIGYSCRVNGIYGRRFVGGYAGSEWSTMYNCIFIAWMYMGYFSRPLQIGALGVINTTRFNVKY